MLSRLAAVTLGDVGFWLLRGSIWAVCMALIAYMLGLEWSWRLCTICIASSFIDKLVWPEK